MRTAFLGVILAAALLPFGSAAADLPLARLLWVFPTGATLGTTNEVTVSGTDLDEPVALRFSDPRVTATPKVGSPNQFQVVVPAEATEGFLDVRFLGRFGLSNPRTFSIHRGPVLVVPANNLSQTSAISAALDQTICARAQANAASWFQFDASAGERLLFEVRDRDLNSRFVPDLAVFSLDGRELARARRHSLLDFKAPAQGRFLLQINDNLFRGGDEYFYQLTLHHGPWLDFAIPNVLTRGITNHVRLFGRELPGGTPSGLKGSDGVLLEQFEVDLIPPEPDSVSVDWARAFRRPASALIAGGAFLWNWQNPSNPVVHSNPLLFTRTDLPVIVSPGSEPAEVTPPCEVSGLFPARGHRAGARFKANKGDVLWFEVYADRLGQPCDPHGLIQRELPPKEQNGQPQYSDLAEWSDTDLNVGDREFNTAHRDAALRWEAPETGTYRVLVRDLFHPGTSQSHLPFRLSLRRETPDFQLITLATPPPRIGDDRSIQVNPLTVRRGQTTALKVAALRRDGFGGDIELSVSGLPPGVTNWPAVIRTGENTATLLLTASNEAQGVGFLKVEGRGKVGELALNHTALSGSVVWRVPDFNNQNAVSRFHRETLISVIDAESASIAIHLSENRPVEAAPDGKFTVAVAVIRKGDFTGAFNLKPAGVPGIEKAKEFNIPDKATQATIEWNATELGIPPGTHRLWLTGTVAGKYRNNPEALAAAEQELKAADQALASATAEGKAKAEERRKAAEERRKAAEEKAKPQDVNIAVWSEPFVLSVPAKPVEAKK